MPMHTMTAMFHSKQEAEHAAHNLRTNSSLGVANVKVLPEENDAPTAGHEQGFLASLRNFFMPEEDRYGFAEGMRRGDYMVAVDAEEARVQQVMDVLEEAGAIDLDAEEERWRSEGWRGTEVGHGSSTTTATAGNGAATMGAGNATLGAGAATIPPVPGTTSSPATRMPDADTSTAGTVTDRSSASTMAARDVESTTGRTTTDRVAADARTAGLAGRRDDTEESIPLMEERLRVGKRQVIGGRVRIRSYVVETPVTETVHLRQEHVDVERRPVDRPLTGNEGDPFREHEIEATETREEPVISKDARVREELVLHKSVEERDETVRDSVRHTEVREDRGGETVNDPAEGTTRTPASPRRP